MESFSAFVICLFMLFKFHVCLESSLEDGSNHCWHVRLPESFALQAKFLFDILNEPTYYLCWWYGVFFVLLLMSFTSLSFCWTLLWIKLHILQAFMANVICPNKHQEEPEKFHNNRLLESETYIGGHVECLESGVFRSDLPTKFQLDPSAYEVFIYFF